jgi:hypothetical protein
MFIFIYKELYMKRTIVALTAIAALSLSIAAQDKPALSPSSSLPVPDGVVKAKEYQFNTTVSGMGLGATLGSDGMVYLSIQAATAGWVALGVGGPKMDGSRLFLAFDAGSKQVFNEQKGAGHSHGDVTDPVVAKWAVKQSGGTTTLELVLPASEALTKGKLDLLFSYSDSTSYSQRHKARGSMEIAVSGIDS